MYHFVGCDENLKGISLKNFKAQLDFLQKTYPRDEIVVSFDHGTIDHLENVAPELERRNLKGIFFILTVTPEEHRVVTIDKQRYLEASLRAKLAKMVCSEFNIDYNPKEVKGYLSEFNFYSLEERYLRYLRDKIIPREVYNGFISKYFEKSFGNEKNFASKKYLSWEHIIQLHKRGHIIGSHSHYHDGDRDDYAQSLKLIQRRTREKPQYISYPNGIKRISDEDLENLGVKKAYLSTKNGTELYRIGRIDCNNWSLIASQ